MHRFSVLCLLFATSLLTACVSTPAATTPHKVRVVDAETGAPVAGAAIDLHYFPSLPQAPDPAHPHAVANAQGEVTIQSMATPAIWQVRAQDYVEQQLVGSQGALPPRYAAPTQSSPDGVIHLYRLPEPQLTVQVSDTYVGPLTINLQPAPGFDYVPINEIGTIFAAVEPQASYVQQATGTRTFSATASPEGVVDLQVTPLLYDIKAGQLQIKDSTGMLPYRDIANPQDKDRGVWGSVIEDDKQLHHQIRLFVGTLADYSALAGVPG